MANMQSAVTVQAVVRLRFGLQDFSDFSILYLSGRCVNGAERDSGTKFHVVSNISGKALCGIKPGKRSAGWLDAWQLPQQITCPKCLRKSQKEEA